MNRDIGVDLVALPNRRLHGRTFAGLWFPETAPLVTAQSRHARFGDFDLDAHDLRSSEQIVRQVGWNRFAGFFAWRLGCRIQAEEEQSGDENPDGSIHGKS